MGDDTRKVKSEPLRVDPILHSTEFRAMAANLESMASALTAANERADRAEERLTTSTYAYEAEWDRLRRHAARWKALAVRLKAFERLREMALDAVATERDQLRAEVERLRAENTRLAGMALGDEACVVGLQEKLNRTQEWLDRFQGDHAEASTTNTALRAALKRFGSHRVECNSNNSVNFAGKKGLPCDCGLDAALAGGAS